MSVLSNTRTLERTQLQQSTSFFVQNMRIFHFLRLLDCKYFRERPSLKVCTVAESPCVFANTGPGDMIPPGQATLSRTTIKSKLCHFVSSMILPLNAVLKKTHIYTTDLCVYQHSNFAKYKLYLYTVRIKEANGKTKNKSDLFTFFLFAQYDLVLMYYKWTVGQSRVQVISCVSVKKLFGLEK